jgi:hypothetical protein
MRTPAIIASLTVVGSIAYAAGSQGVAGKQSPVMPTPPTLPPMGGGVMRSDGGAAMQVGGGGQCVIGEPLNWFTTVRTLPDCYGELWAGTLRERTALDVDGDDIDDLIVAMRITPNDPDDGTPDGIYLGTDWMTMWSGSNSSGAVFGNCCVGKWALFLCKTTLVGQETILTLRPVMSINPLLAIRSLLPGLPDTVGEEEFYFSALHDVDGDGDPDLILQVRYKEFPSLTPKRLWVWVENVAVANSPLTADLNSDGRVGGEDLAILLAGWTP